MAILPALPALDRPVFVFQGGTASVPFLISRRQTGGTRLLQENRAHNNALLPQAWLGVVQQTVKLQNRIPG